MNDWRIGFSLFGAVMLAAPFAWSMEIPSEARAAEIVFLGEIHDNPHHHAVQADWVEALQPQALVFEMLTEEAAARVTPELRADGDALEAALQWEASGWPDFSMYYPIFEAAPDAQVYGAAIPRVAARGMMEGKFAPVLSDRVVSIFGLNEPLSEDQQQKREALQATAHCDALPAEFLPGMVTVQRARDVSLAAAALAAYAAGHRPVVVITGNGHARKDWGAPAALAQAAPDLTLFALGQGEDAAHPGGTFDIILDAPGVDRPDPCAAFR